MEGITALAQRIATLQQTLAPPAPTLAPPDGFAAQLDQRIRSVPGLHVALGSPGETAVAVPPGQLLTPVDGRLSSDFGPRVHPITGEHRAHAGIDIAAPTGTPILAAAGGVVTFAGARGGYGNLVTVDHGDGLETRYAHQDRIDVRVGQRVDVGTSVGTVGSTGLSTGPHLHFEVRRDGEAVDPAPYLSTLAA